MGKNINDGILKIFAVSGSLRADSSNTPILRAMAYLAQDCAQIEIYEGLPNLPHFNPDLDGENRPPATVTDWRDKLKQCNGVLMSIPEYAHGVPGAFKNALDWVVGSGELVGKPVAIINISPRSTYAEASLKETLSVMSADIITAASITVPLAGRKLSENDIATETEISVVLRAAIEAFILRITA
jgi:NAD(P)H-dependent FMN reductase